MANRPGDWFCRSCQHHNFNWRNTCQVCNDLIDYRTSIPMPANGDRGAGVLAGDWYCTSGNCGAHNYASRMNCFICGGVRDDADARSRGTRSSGWKSGDWMCTRPGCNEHNFASRTECFKCNTPKYGSG
ncbi:hypothetical protein MKW94_006988 [Papaver nudicaule]|uniref:RanBP2-type domain-containing protein n=1 Tax=Papaver nudicaule TaxID=74823 RepID=A0AA41SI71_PAPNU|nr:hypothetical protein [Papaver nudicaule]